MKYSWIIILVLVPMTFLAQTFKVRGLSTSIDRVTVYLQGAQISRTGSLDIHPGEYEVVVESLSPYIDKKSLQVSAIGDFTIISVNHRFSYLNKLNRSAHIDSLTQMVDSIEMARKNYHRD